MLAALHACHAGSKCCSFGGQSQGVEGYDQGDVNICKHVNILKPLKVSSMLVRAQKGAVRPQGWPARGGGAGQAYWSRAFQQGGQSHESLCLGVATTCLLSSILKTSNRPARPLFSVFTHGLCSRP